MSSGSSTLYELLKRQLNFLCAAVGTGKPVRMQIPRAEREDPTPGGAEGIKQQLPGMDCFLLLSLPS